MSDVIVLKDVGTATAYGYAVDAGYTGTEEEFAALMASYAEVAEEAAQSARNAAGSASDAADAKDAAVRAKEDAQGAQTAAETAQGLAEGAATAAGGSASSASADALKAEGFAVGEQGGEPVVSGDYFENNAKYYASEAEDSATQAAASAATSAAMTGLADQFDSTKAYAAGDYVLYNGVLYQFTAAHAAGAWTGTDAVATVMSDGVTELKSQIDKKADITGTVDNAEQLRSENAVVDKVPYLFRPSAGDGADREFDTLVGGTVAWNQLAKQSAPVTKTFTDGDNYNGYLHVLDSDATTIAGHKYFFGVNIDRTISANDFLMIMVYNTQTGISVTYGNGSPSGWAYNICECAKASSNNYLDYNNYNGKRGFESGDQIVFSNTMLIDLTQMFGATIADYIYGLETNNAGDGVAWFRKYFNKAFYPYNPGTLLSVNASAHEMVGFNQWDEEAEMGGISSSTGQNESANDRIRSKNYIPLIPGAVYYAKVDGLVNNDFRMYYYDADKNFLSAGSWQWSATFTAPANAFFGRFVRTKITTYSALICISINSDRNGDYEPYEKHTYPLDPDLTLRGIPKLDASNDLYYDGDEYAADGKVTRRYALVDLGTLTWTHTPSLDRFYSNAIDDLKAVASDNTVANAVCSRYSIEAVNHIQIDDGDKVVGTSTSKRVIVRDSAYDNLTSFTAAMSGVYLLYELATETTEEADPFQSPQILSPYGTEAYAVTEQSGVAVPVGHSTRYPTNQVKKLDGLPSNFSTLIAPTEATMKATRNYTTNQFLIVANQLYKVTANIASGGTLTPNSNITATTIGEVLTALLNA